MTNKNKAIIDQLFSCDPNMCIREHCPIYLQEEACCDASRLINMLTSELKVKFRNTATYSIYSEETKK